jgi:dinuclear metal center YbgI/SA1388 family protein
VIAADAVAGIAADATADGEDAEGPAATSGSRGPTAAVPLVALLAHLDELLEVGAVRDACPNGLQVAGPTEVTSVVTGVSACRELFARARQLGAQLVLVHHGIFWEGQSPVLRGPAYDRVAELIAGKIALAGYHLPLDRHPKLGNNALAAERLGLADRERWGEYGGIPIGYRGRLSEPLAASELAERCERLFGRKVDLFGDPERPVAEVGVVSGAAASLFPAAIAAGFDAYITGEPSEWVVNLARESGTRFLAAGHYATEVLGIRALGDYVAERYGIAVEFVDVPNPV